MIADNPRLWKNVTVGNFDQWMRELHAEAHRRDYHDPDNFLSHNADAWQKRYDRGMSPVDALNRDEWES